MKRQTLVLAILASLLVVVAFHFLAFQPQRDALAEVQDRIVAEQDQQRTLQAQLDALRVVREQAPEVEAQLVAGEAIIPRDAAVPSALRQLQVAAEDSNAVLHTVAAARPAQIEGATPGLSSIVLNVQLGGSYFQIVDFLRRLEDPSISPRGTVWSSITVTKDEYPSLTVALSGSMFTLLPEPPPETDPAAETAAPADGASADGDAAESADDAGDATTDDAPAPPAEVAP